MIIGFTGTREGMGGRQEGEVYWQLCHVHEAQVLHHGDCYGADAQANYLAWHHGISRVIHPPTNPRYRAWGDKGLQWDVVLLPEKPYLERNRDIVDACDRLIAAPKENSPRDRKGGTWYTIGYAMRVGKPVTIVWPDGSADDFGAVLTQDEQEYMRQREEDPEFRAWDDKAIELHEADRRARQARGGEIG